MVAYVDELIVVNNGALSHNDAQSIAETFGCLVLNQSYVSSEAGRDEYLKAATQSWIFVLDPDERITVEGGKALKQTIAGATAGTMAFVVPRFDYCGRGKWAHTPHLRLFRNHPAIRYARYTHASVGPTIEALSSKISAAYVPIHHLDMLLHNTDPLHRNRTTQKRYEYLPRMIAEMDEHPIFRCFIGLEYTARGQYYEAEQVYQSTISMFDSYVALTARIFLAHLRLLQNDLVGAESEANTLMSLGTDFRLFERVFFVRAEVALRQHRALDALRICLDALDVCPNLPNMHINVAALLEDKDPLRAIDHLSNAITLNPYVLQPIIYRSAERLNLFQQQLSFLTCTRTIHEHMERCWINLGEREIADGWKQAGNRIETGQLCEVR